MQEKEKDPLVTAVAFFNLPNDGPPVLIEVSPSTYEISDAELPLLVASVQPVFKGKKTSYLYTFNTQAHMCFGIYFEMYDEKYSLVLMTSYPFASFFGTLIYNIIEEFNTCPEMCEYPYDIYRFVQTVIKKLPTTGVPDKLKVRLPTRQFDWRFGQDDYTYQDFNPTLFFDKKECDMLWRAVFVGDPVLIIGDDTASVSEAVMSVMSLLFPMQYESRFCLWLTVTDPRFVEIVSGCSDYSIVGTDSESLAGACDTFKYIFRLPKTLRNPASEVVSRLRLRVKRSISIAQYVLDNLMLYDSYCDFLEQPMYSSAFAEELKMYKKYDLPTADEFRRWEKTETFKQWRRKRDTHASFRDALLSTEPERIFKGKSRWHLMIIQKRLENLKKDFEKDLHAKVVLRRHLKYINTILESDAEP